MCGKRRPGRSVRACRSASTSTPTVAATPSATPTPSSIAVLDGEPWIAYGWPRVATDGRWAIFLVRPDGTDAHEIAADVPGEHKLPAWSPDGSRLAFVVQDDDHPEGSIWMANADGSDASLLSGGGAECPVGLFHPAWSPDGTKLAVVCYPGGDDHESVAVMDLATTSIRRLADFTHPDAVNSAPTWSPDGRTIAFEILRYDPTNTFTVGSVVATVPAEGGEVQRLTSPERFMVHPDWSPDGAELVMNDLASSDRVSRRTSMRSSRMGRVSTHSPTRRSTATCGSRRRDWDPDGSRILVSIVYTTGPDFEFGGEVRLAFVDGAGGEPVLISKRSGKYPDLRPTP